jgi:hypothetical protein
MCTKLIDRMTGSNRPRHDNVSLKDSQKDVEPSDLVTGAGRIGPRRTGGTGVCCCVALVVDIGVCCDVSVGAEGADAAEGNEDCDGEGAIVATIADNFSNFLSKSRTLLDAWPSLLALAGLLRATCSTHSTRAFWHLARVNRSEVITRIGGCLPLADTGSVRWDTADLVFSAPFASKCVSYSSFSHLHRGDGAGEFRLIHVGKSGEGCQKDP